MPGETEPVVPASHLDILTKAGFAHMATVGPSGEPQSTPVWYSWDGDHVLVSQTTGRQKYKNLTRRPEVAISIVDPDNPYRYVELRGTVESMEDDPENTFINSMAKKYLNEDVYPWHQPTDHRVVVKIHPVHATTQG